MQLNQTFLMLHSITNGKDNNIVFKRSHTEALIILCMYKYFHKEAFRYIPPIF